MGTFQPLRTSRRQHEPQDPHRAIVRLLCGQRCPSGRLRPSIGEQVRTEAARQGINLAFVEAIARNEGGTNRISPADAVGTMQLMPRNAGGLGVNPYDQRENVEGGVRYLREMLERFGGNDLVAGAAYNRGPNAASVQHFAATGDRSRLPAETQTYLSRLEQQGVGSGRSGVHVAQYREGPRSLWSPNP